MNEATLPEMFGRITKVLFSQSTWIPSSLRWMLLFTVLIVPQVLWGADWFATVGAQSNDKGRQALAFLPNEIWIHGADKILNPTGDSITWTIDVDEPHTVTFLADGEAQNRPPFFMAPFKPSPATFDGSTSVSSTGNTASIAKGNKFRVFFPTAGDFKLVCLFHENMTGVVHVLPFGTPLPHNQDFYDRQAADQRRDLLSDRDGRLVHGDHREHGECAASDSLKARLITAGIGEISATPGGTQTLSVMRFIDNNIQIRAGDTVEWTNQDPVTPHTVTFGTEPKSQDLPSPSANPPTLFVDPEGVLHAVINSPGDSVNSGFLMATLQDQTGNKQTPIGFTRFRITFPNPGVFPYICGLHDILGMTGTVTVH
jgi:plastocyanin